MKSKYSDNKLAEEFDCILLTKPQKGLPIGSLGTLICSYTRTDKPLYAEFACADGTSAIAPLSLQDFRVLNERNQSDLQILLSFIQLKSSKIG